MFSFCDFFFWVLRLDQNLRYIDSDTESDCSKLSSEHKDIDKEKEKVDTKQFYTCSSYNPGIVQSPCTSKRFHYNHTRLQIAQGHLQETSQCSSTTARVFYVLGLYLKASCSRTTPRDFPLLKHNCLRLFLAQSQLTETS